MWPQKIINFIESPFFKECYQDIRDIRYGNLNPKTNVKRINQRSLFEDFIIDHSIYLRSCILIYFSDFSISFSTGTVIFRYIPSPIINNVAATKTRAEYGRR